MGFREEAWGVKAQLVARGERRSDHDQKQVALLMRAAAAAAAAAAVWLVVVLVLALVLALLVSTAMHLLTTTTTAKTTATVGGARTASGCWRQLQVRGLCGTPSCSRWQRSSFSGRTRRLSGPTSRLPRTSSGRLTSTGRTLVSSAYLPGRYPTRVNLPRTHPLFVPSDLMCGMFWCSSLVIY